MSAQYPKDEFDRAGEDMPVGMHRPQPSKWKSVWPFLVILVLIPIIGWGVSTLLTSRGVVTKDTVADLSSQSATAEPTAEPTGEPTAEATQEATAEPEPTQEPTPEETKEAASVNHSVSVQVLNGTGITGYAAEQAAILTNAGYTAVSAANATGWATEVSTVYYEGAENVATAQDVGAQLGIANVQETTGLTSPVVVILR